MYLIFEGFDTQNGTNHLALKMIDEFLVSNIDTYLVTSHSKGINDDIPSLLVGRNGFTFDIVNRAKVKKTNFVQRYIDGVLYSFKAMKAWRKNIDSVDVVIIQSTPTAVFSSVLLYLFGRKPIIYNCYDVFPDGAYALGAFKSKSLYSVLKLLQSLVYKSSSAIVAISEDMKRNMKSLGVPSDKVVEIKNWYDDSSVKLVDYSNNQFAKKYGISDKKFYVQYAGNFGYTFDYKYVIEVASILKSEHNIEFHMIGEGALKNQFLQEAKLRNLNNIIFYPWQPQNIISDVYSMSDVQLIPLSKGVIANSFPSKGSLLMACGKVILCATEANSNYYTTINENKIGFCVPNSLPEEAAKKIKYLFYNQTELKVIGDRAKLYGEKLYSSSANVYKYIDLVEEVIKKHNKTY